MHRPSTKKPKSRKINILAPSASISAALSTATLPLPALSVAGPSNGASISSHSKVVKIEDGSREAPIALSDGEDNGKLKRRLEDLIGDALIIADQAKFDVFNGLSLMDNVHFLHDLKVMLLLNLTKYVLTHSNQT